METTTPEELHPAQSTETPYSALYPDEGNYTVTVIIEVRAPLSRGVWSMKPDSVVQLQVQGSGHGMSF